MTQDLVVHHSLGEFLLELEKVQEEYELVRPPRWALLGLRGWRNDRRAKIAEVVKKYVELGYDAMASLRQARIQDVDLKIIEEASCHLIKATCAMDEENKKSFRHDFEKIFKYEKQSDYVSLVFVLRLREKALGFSEQYQIDYRLMKIFTDVPNGQSGWFSGQWKYEDHCGRWVNRFELHVRSEDEIKFLLSP